MKTDDLQEHFSPRAQQWAAPSSVLTTGAFLVMIPKRIGNYIKRPQEERYWAKVNKHGPVPTHRPELGPCWVWTGCLSHGYGHILFNGKVQQVNRVAFLLDNGRWPNPFACHECDNKKCVRPDHLFEGTNRDNMIDMVRKGRACTSYPSNTGENNCNAKLTWGNVDIIREEHPTVGMVVLAKRFHVSHQVIHAVIKFRTWKPEHRPA